MVEYSNFRILWHPQIFEYSNKWIFFFENSNVSNGFFSIPSTPYRHSYHSVTHLPKFHYFWAPAHHHLNVGYISRHSTVSACQRSLRFVGPVPQSFSTFGKLAHPYHTVGWYLSQQLRWCTRIYLFVLLGIFSKIIGSQAGEQYVDPSKTVKSKKGPSPRNWEGMQAGKLYWLADLGSFGMDP